MSGDEDDEVPDFLTRRQALTFLDALVANFDDKELTESTLLTKFAEKYPIQPLNRQTFSTFFSQLKNCQEHVTYLKKCAKDCMATTYEEVEESEATDEDDSVIRQYAVLSEPKYKKPRKEEGAKEAGLIKEMVEELRGQTIITKKQLAPQLKVRAEVPEDFTALCIERYITMRKATSKTTTAATWKINFVDFLSMHGYQPRSNAIRHEIFQIREELASWIMFAPDDSVLSSTKEAWFLPFSLLQRLLMCFARMHGKNVDLLQKKAKISWATGYVDIVDMIQQCSSGADATDHQGRFSAYPLGQAAPREYGSPRQDHKPPRYQKDKDKDNPSNPKLPPRTCRYCGAKVVGPFRMHRCNI